MREYISEHKLEKVVTSALNSVAGMHSAWGRDSSDNRQCDSNRLVPHCTCLACACRHCGLLKYRALECRGTQLLETLCNPLRATPSHPPSKTTLVNLLTTPVAPVPAPAPLRNRSSFAECQTPRNRDVNGYPRFSQLQVANTDKQQRPAIGY